MSEEATNFYLNILKNILDENFDSGCYCIGNQQDSSVCLRQENSNWVVFGCNRLAIIEKKSFYTVVEAAMEMLSRLCDEAETIALKSRYFMQVYEQITE